MKLNFTVSIEDNDGDIIGLIGREAVQLILEGVLAPICKRVGLQVTVTPARTRKPKTNQ